MTSIHTAPNEVRRFIVENQPVRGYWVDLESAWQDVRAHQDYPPPVRNLLGEAVSAAVLLAATLKFEGTLTLQLEGQGHVRLLVAQCTHDFHVRAVARLSQPEPGERSRSAETVHLPPSGAASDALWPERPAVVDLGAVNGTDPLGTLSRITEAASGEMFRSLVGENGRVLVTVEASERGMRYQGIVPLAGNSLSQCLEEYFASSEQLPTRVRLAADNRRAVGLLVQKLPERGREETAAAAAWSRAERSIESVQPSELIGASLQTLLTSRFAQQDLRVFKGAQVQFACRCSEERVAGMLKTLGIEELRQVLREQGAVEVTCEFCQRPYRFDAFAVERLFAAEGEPPSLH